VNSGEEYLIPDATTNDFGILELEIMSGDPMVQAGLRFDNRQITLSKMVPGEEGYFKRSTDHLIVSMLL
jgi:iron complex outermembrane receptor protein